MWPEVPPKRPKSGEWGSEKSSRSSKDWRTIRHYRSGDLGEPAAEIRNTGGGPR